MAPRKKATSKQHPPLPKNAPGAPESARSKAAKKKGTKATNGQSQKKPKRATKKEQQTAKKEEPLSFPGLKETEAKAAELVASGINFKKIAKSLQIDRKTLYRWRKKTAFIEAVKFLLDEEDGDLLAEARITARMARAALRKSFERQSPQDNAIALRYLERTGLLYVTDEQADREKAIQEAAGIMANILSKHGIESVN
ncbi:MAG: hypothetical protein CMN76_08665 [Spirochaetaceae bacterium]|nr:hypothetical protein [Spirochaetaceae bacterium]|tara:strand:+ start:66544 stop:67137 length:594 start_codon:yes stop_codon:yes gene_type:complete